MIKENRYYSLQHTNDPGSTEDTLKTIDNTISNLVMGENDKQDKADAALLQNFLNDILAYLLKKGNKSDLLGDKIYKEFILGIVRELRKVNKTASRYLFTNTSGTSGKAFESDFAELIDKTFAVAEKKKYIKNKTIVIGANGANVGSMQTNIAGVLDEDIKDLVKDSYEEVGRYIKDNIKTTEESEKSTYTSVDGKIDATGLGYKFDITIENSEIPKILTLFQQSGFTLKDYRRNSVEIASSGANFYRTFYTLASKAGITEDIDGKFWRMINCIQYHKDNDVLTYITRLRLMYELTGIGQNYSLMSGVNNAFRDILTGVQGARFIIRFDGAQCYVQPTSIILKEYLKGKDKEGWRTARNKLNIDRILYGSMNVTVSGTFKSE